MGSAGKTGSQSDRSPLSQPYRRRRTANSGGEPLRVRLDDLRPYEIAGLLLALLVDPRPDDDRDAFEELRRDISAALLVGYARLAPVSEGQQLTISLIHLAPTVKQAEGAWRRVCTIMAKRHAAGRAALRFVSYKNDPLIVGARPALIELVKEALGPGNSIDMKSIMQRHWRDILPVMSICAAFEANAVRVDSCSATPYPLVNLCADVESLDYIVNTAMQVQMAIAELEEFRPSRGRPIELVRGSSS